LTELVPNLIERSQFLVAPKKLCFSAFALANIARDTLNADRVPFPIDQPATELERNSAPGLSADLELVHGRHVSLSDLAREHLAGDLQLIGNNHLGKVHSKCFCSRVFSQPLTGPV